MVTLEKDYCELLCSSWVLSTLENYFGEYDLSRAPIQLLTLFGLSVRLEEASKMLALSLR